MSLDVTPEQLLDEWVNRLEEADLPQIEGRLVDTIVHGDEPGVVGYCCLGVLCLVAEEHGLVEQDDSGNWTSTGDVPGYDVYTHDGNYDQTDTEIPYLLATWLGIEQNPLLGNLRAVERNDNEHQPFAEIAVAARSQYADRLAVTE